MDGKGRDSRLRSYKGAWASHALGNDTEDCNRRHEQNQVVKLQCNESDAVDLKDEVDVRHCVSRHFPRLLSSLPQTGAGGWED